MVKSIKIDLDLFKRLKQDLNISFEDMSLLTLLILLSDNENNCCDISNEELADYFVTGERNVRKKLLKLENAGLIKRQSAAKNRLIYPQVNLFY